jgi:EcsC protein family
MVKPSPLSRDCRNAMTDEDLKELRAAVRTLEHPGLAARLSELAGRPVELMRQALPAGASNAVMTATAKALEAAVSVALRSLRNEPQPGSHRLHKGLVAGTGAVGGAFGLLALPFELPVSTIIMLRSILDIAREQGEDLHDPAAALSCLQVFALSGRPGGITGGISESGYFAVRAMLAKSLTEAARFVAERGLVAEGAPAVVRFITQIATRFGVVVTQKMAAQALPVLGGLGGAAVNYAFITHFQAMARAHFTVRRLERRYGMEAVRTEYERIRTEGASGNAFAA